MLTIRTMNATRTTRFPLVPPARLARAAVLALCFATTLLCSAEAPPMLHSVIRLEQVVAALNASGLSLASAEVRLLAENLATIVEPGLEVRGLEPWGDRGARVRMGCVAHEQCLPFYVAVSWPDPDAAGSALHAKGALAPDHGRESRPAQQARRDGVPSAPVQDAPGLPSAVSTRPVGPVAGATGTQVHAGSQAVLLIDGGRLHIKVPVICLEAGEAGHTIRVTALDHRQTYRAEVVDSTLLKGTL